VRQPSLWLSSAEKNDFGGSLKRFEVVTKEMLVRNLGGVSLAPLSRG
jgi:hypothetical protein